MFLVLISTVVGSVLSSGVVSDSQGVEYIPFDGEVGSLIKNPEPHTYLKASDLPINYHWRNINNTNYCGKVLNQKNPNVCGSCWAHAAASALTDRYKIATNNLFNLQLSPQNLINFNLRCVYYVYCV